MFVKRLSCKHDDAVQVKPTKHEVTVLKVLSPVLWMAHFCGLRFYHQKIHFLRKCIVKGIILALIVYSFIHELPSIEYWQSNSTGLFSLIVRLDNFSWWFCLIINFWLTTFKNNKLNVLIDKVQLTNVPLSHKTQRKIFRFHLIHLVMNTLLLVAYNVFGYDYAWPNPNYDFLTSKIYFLGDLILFLPFYEFLHLINCVGELFKEINYNIKKFKSKYSGNVNWNDLRFSNENIIRLRHSHLNLTEMCVEINACYSEQLLVVLCYGMIQTIYAVRSIIGDFHLTEIEDSIVNIIADTFWFIPFFMSFIQMIFFCEKTSKECNKTLVVIHNLMNIYFYEEEVIRELELFAMQVQRHRLRFHVRFFDLHYHFLNILVSSLMTYFVVIATFQGESDNGKLRSWNYNTPGSFEMEPTTFEP